MPAVAASGQLYRAESRVRFIEPDAFLVVALVSLCVAVGVASAATVPVDA